MKNKKMLLVKSTLLLGVFVLLFSCKDDTYTYRPGVTNAPPYDPGKPVEITSFMPDSGKVREKVIIKGKNFGNDPSKITVYFNDGVSDKQANVISVDGTSIYCLAPRQNSGDNKIKVKVMDGEPISAPGEFVYTASANISWVAGKGKVEGAGAKYKDGSLSESHIWRPQGIGYIGDNQMLTFGWHEALSSKVRMISIDDDKVSTIQEGVYLGKPAVNASKTRVYATSVNRPHTVYEYRKEAGWTPYTIGEINVPNYTSQWDLIRAVAMLDEESDPNQEWVYFCHRDHTFGRFNIETEETQIIADRTLDIPNVWGGYLVYNKVKDCFYLSLYERFSIYRIIKTGNDWSDGVKAELYAGSPSQSDVIDGALEDARFKEPMGMCVDEDGNVYVCDRNAHVIRKISAVDGYVSTIAGIKGVEGAINGNPEEATLFFPQDITYDDEGSYYIAEDWESTIRKYSIE